jgi:acetyl esterase/lipase
MLQFLVAALLVQTPEVTKDIEYRKANDQSMQLDFYKPVTLSTDPAPLVIVIHGGSWMQGTRGEMGEFAKEIAKQGFASATISYRLAPKDKWPAMLDDCQAAVRFMRTKAREYNIDPTRVASLGASAGGHLALLLGLTDTRDKTTLDYPLASSRTQCVINLFGPVDLAHDFTDTAFGSTMTGILCMQVLGKKYDDATEEIKAFSPITYVAKDSPPIFTIHGKSDTLVPFKQAERLDEALGKFNVVHETVLIEGMGHELPIDKPEVAEAVAKALSFLKTHLMPVKQI